MKALAALLGLALVCGGLPAEAHEPTDHPEQVAAAAPDELPAAAQAAVDIVDAFGKALAAGDFKAVESLLDPGVLILESGGAERSRDEYLGHHAIADAQFLMNAQLRVTRRRARVSGDLAWVATESEIQATDDGKPMTLLSTETMVLCRTEAGWRIVHIHWSSRPKKT
jgi:ketosteroid isomerase-like protein